MNGKTYNLLTILCAVPFVLCNIDIIVENKPGLANTRTIAHLKDAILSETITLRRTTTCKRTTSTRLTSGRSGHHAERICWTRETIT